MLFSFYLSRERILRAKKIFLKLLNTLNIKFWWFSWLIFIFSLNYYNLINTIWRTILKWNNNIINNACKWFSYANHKNFFEKWLNITMIKIFTDSSNDLEYLCLFLIKKKVKVNPKKFVFSAYSSGHYL